MAIEKNLLIIRFISKKEKQKINPFKKGFRDDKVTNQHEKKREKKVLCMWMDGKEESGHSICRQFYSGNLLNVDVGNPQIKCCCNKKYPLMI